MAKNKAASIRQQLLNLARERKENFDYVLKVYLIQRLLYRLGEKFQDRFLLKGALLFWVWGENMHRPTRDIDLLGFGDNDIENLAADFRTICSMDVEDGLVFDLDSINGAEIKEDTLYQGVRITGKANLDSAIITFQVGIGFGDAVTPEADRAKLPSFLDLPEAELKVYPVYTVIAEKFQAMVMLDIANSRLKDFYDIWIISSKPIIKGQLLVDAIKATFERRDTDMSKESLSIFEPAFCSDSNKQKQWEAFLRKNGLKSEMTFEQLMRSLESFIAPAYKAARESSNFDSNWLSDQWVQQKKKLESLQKNEDLPILANLSCHEHLKNHFFSGVQNHVTLQPASLY